MKKYQLTTTSREHFPISFDHIRYWKLSEEPERIDNYDDPFFDGIPSEKYQTPAYMPISHFKTISKIVDLEHIQSNMNNE